MIASSEGVGVVFGRGVALVVVERDHPIRDIEDDVAVSTVAVLPAAMGLFENVVGQALDDGGDTGGRTPWFGLIPDGLGEFDGCARHGDLIVSSLNFDILDLTGIAVAVEADDDTRDAASASASSNAPLLRVNSSVSSLAWATAFISQSESGAAGSGVVADMSVMRVS
jgi:hypothetical protein